MEGHGTLRGVTRRRAVLFDWRGTLAHSPPPRWWAERALASIRRPATADVLRQAEAALQEAGDLPDIDSSAQRHREATLRVFVRHGLDAELSEALYELDCDPANHPLYPDADRVLREIRARGAGIALVSDFHVDLRPVLAAHGIADLVDAWVLSFEHGIQKPDARMFTLALDALAVFPDDALMVGDRASHDGGAAAVGIATLILPRPPDRLEARGLEAVTRLLDGPRVV
jgi:HAD superfamily hydrolase (TIGR01493 family)